MHGLAHSRQKILLHNGQIPVTEAKTDNILNIDADRCQNCTTLLQSGQTGSVEPEMMEEQRLVLGPRPS